MPRCRQASEVANGACVWTIASDFGPRAIDVAVEPPLRRRQARTGRRVRVAVERQATMSSAARSAYGQAGRRDEVAVEFGIAPAGADIARLAAVDPERVHLARGRDHRMAQRTLARRASPWGRLQAARGRWPRVVRLKPDPRIGRHRMSHAKRSGNIAAIASRPAATTPRSVMRPVTSRAGVTSNA